MRNFIFAMVLLGLLIGLAVGYQAVVVHFSDTMERHISAMQSDLGAASLDTFLQEWNQMSYYMAYLVDHEHLNSLDASITSLRSAVEARREDEIQHALNHVQTEMKNISEDILFLLKNVF